MRLEDFLIYVLICVGLFFTGVVWAPSFSDPDKIKYYFEVISYIATVLACVVAIATLKSWRSQFKHSEKYAALKSLLEATHEMQAVRSYLISLQAGYLHRYSSGGVESDMLKETSAEELESLKVVHKIFCQRFMLVTTIMQKDEVMDFSGIEMASPEYVNKLGFVFAFLYSDCDKYEFVLEARSRVKAQSVLINNATAWLREKIRCMN